MAKIKKHNYEIRVNGEPKAYTLDVQYANHKFFVMLPEELEVLVSGFKDLVERLGLNVEVKRGKGFQGHSIRADSETKLHEEVRRVLTELLEQAQVERPVIILYYESLAGQHSNFNPSSDVAFEGFKISYKMCTEIRSSLSEHASFYDKEDRRKVYVGHRLEGVVLDDTEANRALVTRLYEGTKTLAAQLAALTKSPEDFAYLASNSKLLN